MAVVDDIIQRKALTAVEDILPAYNPHPFNVSNGLLSSGDLVYAPGGVAGL
ncbi:MAG TPA: hypothetical protein PLQ35_03515 [bacterium]|nr:hypothetical protein [bacterium]HQL61341.1 hypothetical protein [bacterium]